MTGRAPQPHEQILPPPVDHPSNGESLRLLQVQLVGMEMKMIERMDHFLQCLQDCEFLFQL